MSPPHSPQEKLSYLQTPDGYHHQQKSGGRKVVQDLSSRRTHRRRGDLRESGAGGYGSVEDWLVEALLSRLKVETSQSSIIQVTFSSAIPANRRGSPTAFAQSLYLIRWLELRVEPTRQAAAWYDEQLKSLRANLEDAQAKLTITSSGRESSRLTSASMSIAPVGGVVGASGESAGANVAVKCREQQAGASFSNAASSLDRLPDVLDNRSFKGLKTDLNQGEAKAPRK